MALVPDENLYNANNKVRSAALFLECAQPDEELVMFTLLNNDTTWKGKKLPSLKKLYMQFCSEDPTEYSFANHVFGSWDAWCVIKSTFIVRGYVKKWSDEVVVLIKSTAIATIHQEMLSGGKSSFQAAKFLIDKGWIPPQMGRKSTKDKETDENQNSRALANVHEDAARLGLFRSN